MSAKEVNFDGLVGPTHNYAGLSYGNVASKSNVGKTAKPKQAALQGLDKMEYMLKSGLVQGVLPPQLRPNFNVLRNWGFTGKDEEIVAKAAKEDPVLLSLTYSASCMWSANAATVSPSYDSADGKVHFTPANLLSNAHRAIESLSTYEILNRVFNNKDHFIIHEPLKGGDVFSDEGAANHTRFCDSYDSKGVQLFVYGRKALDINAPKPHKFPARQTYESCVALARLHQLNSSQVLFLQQNPEVINAGVFHNDVISVGNKNVLLYHEEAFINFKQVKESLSSNISNFNFIEVKKENVSIQDAVESYLFNTQLVEVSENEMHLIAPIECQENKKVNTELKRIVEAHNPITDVKFFDLRQSMQNGGGPACLRLRVVLSEAEISKVNQACILDSVEKIDVLRSWVNKHYREELGLSDLADPALIKEVRSAHDELNKILSI